jgi:tetratricopeptide (TPR) repeat protein
MEGSKMYRIKSRILVPCTLAVLLAAPLHAADSGIDESTFKRPESGSSSRNASPQVDLTAIRAKIKAKNYASALEDLQRIGESDRNADVYNLLGFAMRKSGGDKAQAQTYYKKALSMNPSHKRALEYQGELYVELGQVAKAKENLAKLATLCPSGCEERDDLEKAIAKGAATTKAN